MWKEFRKLPVSSLFRAVDANSQLRCLAGILFSLKFGNFHCQIFQSKTGASVSLRAVRLWRLGFSSKDSTLAWMCNRPSLKLDEPGRRDTLAPSAPSSIFSSSVFMSISYLASEKGKGC